MYSFKQFGDRYILSIDNHQEISAALKAFCEEQGVRCGVVSGIGAVNEATLRFLDPVTKSYVDKTFSEQMEIASLVGNISEKDGEIYLHLHLTLGRSDYSCVGGHMMTARLNGACELYVEKLPGSIGRRFDPSIGLNVYDL